MEGHCYIAIESCGCATGIVCDIDTGLISPKKLSEDIADFIKSGRTVERVPISEGKNRFGVCKCGLDKGNK